MKNVTASTGIVEDRLRRDLLDVRVVDEQVEQASLAAIAQTWTTAKRVPAVLWARWPARNVQRRLRT